MIDQIKYVNIAVTNRCNLTCRHCSIWREKPKKDILPEIVRKIVRSKFIAENADISLTGGEPFLHKNFIKLVDLILKEKPGSLKSIVTNGTLKDRMRKLFGMFREPLAGCSLHISFDGVTRHDEQRGKSSQVIRRNIEFIKKNFPGINIALKFTVTKINHHDIVPTCEYAELNNLGFKIKLVENARNYTNKISAEKKPALTLMEKKSIARDLLSICHNSKALKNKDVFFVKETIRFLLGKSRLIFCKTPSNRIFVMPDGRVYSCIYFHSIGNLNDASLKEIWHSDQAQLIRGRIRRHGCKGCLAYHGFDF